MPVVPGAGWPDDVNEAHEFILGEYVIDIRRRFRTARYFLRATDWAANDEKEDSDQQIP